MKKFDVAQTIGVLANLGVVAGVVALIIEINQNTAHTRALLVLDEAISAIGDDDTYDFYLRSIGGL